MRDIAGIGAVDCLYRFAPRDSSRRCGAGFSEHVSAKTHPSSRPVSSSREAYCWSAGEGKIWALGLGGVHFLRYLLLRGATVMPVFAGSSCRVALRTQPLRQTSQEPRPPPPRPVRLEAWSASLLTAYSAAAGVSRENTAARSPR